MLLRWLRRTGGAWLWPVGAFVLAVVLSQFAPLVAADNFLQSHTALERALALGTAGVVVVGGALLLSPLALGGPGRRAEDLAGPGTCGLPPILFTERRNGTAVTFEMEGAFSAMKQAVRRRAWRTSRPWLLFVVTGAGAVLITLGLLGFLFVAGTPAIKGLAALLLIYAVARMAWGFVRA